MQLLKRLLRWLSSPARTSSVSDAGADLRPDEPHVRIAGAGAPVDVRCQCHLQPVRGKVQVTIDVHPIADRPEDHPRNYLASGFLVDWIDGWDRRDWWYMSEIMADAEEVLQSLIQRDAGEGEVGFEKGGGV